jgi:hypothetical protein
MRVGKDHLEMNYGIGAVGVAVVALHPYLFNFLGILGAVLATSLSFASVSRTATQDCSVKTMNRVCGLQRLGATQIYSQENEPGLSFDTRVWKERDLMHYFGGLIGLVLVVFLVLWFTGNVGLIHH